MRISDWSSDVCSSDLVDEIRSAGGRAVADTHSVASADGAAAVVATALATFGSLDVLVNNAAISVSAPFDVMTPHDFRGHIDINLRGAYYICRAAWPHMRERRYVRMVKRTQRRVTGTEAQTT